MLLSLALFDGALLAGTYNVLFFQRFDRWPGLTGSISTLVILWVGSSYLLGRYSRSDPSKKDSQRQRLLTTLTTSGIVLASVVIVANWGLKIDDPRTFRSFVIPVLGSTTLGSHCIQIAVTARQRRAQHWLLVGNSNEISIIKKELESGPPKQRTDITFLNTDEVQHLQNATKESFDGIAVSEIAEVNDSVVEKLLALRGKGKCVYSLVSWSEQYLQRVPPELFSNRWLVQAEGFELQPGRLGWRVKRLADVIVATSLLIATAPVMALAAIAIKLEDGGDILYEQVRTGLYGTPFVIRKLRSMRKESEPDGAQWSNRNDPRITAVGTWIRRLRIDELPQLISVLKGEMSLIGPRPERPEIEVILEQKIHHYRVRHWVRPGLSGWAQVCFPYTASVEDSRRKLCYDLYYIRNSSIFLDLLILLKTIRLVTRAQGAVPAIK